LHVIAVALGGGGTSEVGEGLLVGGNAVGRDVVVDGRADIGGPGSVVIATVPPVVR
jgi:hypothetical protein